MRSSEQITVGAQIEPLVINTDIERFLSLTGFQQRGKLEEMNFDVGKS
jgi:hypothetical protein